MVGISVPNKKDALFFFGHFLECRVSDIHNNTPLQFFLFSFFPPSPPLFCLRRRHLEVEVGLHFIYSIIFSFRFLGIFFFFGCKFSIFSIFEALTVKEVQFFVCFSFSLSFFFSLPTFSKFVFNLNTHTPLNFGFMASKSHKS